MTRTRTATGKFTRVGTASAVSAAVTVASFGLGAPAAQATAACTIASTAYDRQGNGKVYALETVSQAGTCTWTRPTGAEEVSFLVVGGGGAAGITANSTNAYPGGGGGGGGVGVYDPVNTAPENEASFVLEVGSGGTIGGGGANAAVAKPSAIKSGSGGATYFTAGSGGGGANGDAQGNALGGSTGGNASSGGSGGGGGLSDNNAAAGGQGGTDSVPPNSSGGPGKSGASAVQSTQSGGGGGAGGNASGTTGGVGSAVPANFAAAFASGTTLAPGGQGGVKNLNSTPTRSSSYGAGGNAYTTNGIAQSTGNSGVIVVRYLVPLSITSVSPSSGTVNSAQSVTITGTGFDTSTASPFGVTIGGSACTSPTVLSVTQITCTAPALGTAGDQAVTVTSKDNRTATKSNVYSVSAPSPVLTGASPSSIPLTGTFTLTVTGTNLPASGSTILTVAQGQTMDTCTATPTASPGTGLTCSFTATKSFSAGSADVSITGAAPLTGGITFVAAPPVPATPTAVAGDAQATVAVTQGSGGGGTPSSFAVTASNGGGTCTISSPSGTPASGSCTITGLTNGTSYTFTATATNDGGTSLPSAASAPVTPAGSGGGGGTGGGGTEGGGTSTPSAPTSSSSSTSTGSAATTAPAPVTIALPPTSGPATAVLVGGQPASVTAQQLPAPVAGASPNGLTVSTAGVQASVTGPPLAGVAEPGNPVMVAGQPFALSVGGLAAGTLVGIYAMPSGILLGTFTVGADGQLIGSPTLPESIAGQVTSIQITGTTAGGSVVNLAFGATVGPPATAVPTPAGPLPAPAPGGSFVMVDQVPVPTTPDRVGATLVVTEQAATVSMRADTATGQARPLGGDGALQIQDDGSVRVEGVGMVGTVDVFAFSTPTYLGRVLVRPDGSFAGALPVPTSLSPGRHTLQLVGDARNGAQVAVSLGVEKTAPASGSRRPVTSSARVFFAANSATLTPAAKATLMELLKRTGTKPRRAVSIGFVQQTDSRGNDLRLSRARAQAAAHYLRSLGLRGPIDVRGRGASGSTAADRSARVTITYLVPTTGA